MDTIELEFDQRIKVSVDLPRLAQFFAMMSDEQQAAFFVEVANFARATYQPSALAGTPEAAAEMQWYFVGKALAAMGPEADAGREMVRGLATDLDHSTPKRWIPTAETIRALPYPVREYIRVLQTKAPTELAQKNAALKQSVNDLQAEVEKLKKDLELVERLRREERESRARW